VKLRLWLKGTLVTLVILFIANYFRERGPTGYEIHGIDVSHYQDDINWNEVRTRNIYFVFVKASEGFNMRDKRFKTNWQSIKEAGLLRGAYHFLNLGMDGEKQANNFIKTVELENGDLPPVLDIEYARNMPDQKTLRKNARDWLDVVERYYGVKPIIYTSRSFYTDYLSGYFDDYPLWLAHYTSTKPDSVAGRNWHFWQYSENGIVHGIDEEVDLNVFNGNLEELKKLCITK